MATRGLNKVHLLGHLTSDAKKIESQRSFGCTFNIAVNRRFKKTSGEFGEETAFIRCAYWNAQRVFEYLKQGRQLVVDGHLSTSQFEDKATGKKMTVMEVNVDELILTDSKPATSNGGREQDPAIEDCWPEDVDSSYRAPASAPAPAKQAKPRLETADPESFRSNAEYREYLEGVSEQLTASLDAERERIAAREAEVDAKIKALSETLPVEDYRPPVKASRQAHKRPTAKRKQVGR